MASSSRSRPIDRTGWMLALIFTAVLGSFAATTFAIRRASSRIDLASNDLVTDSTPSIERLAAVHGSTLAVQLALSRYVDADAATRADRMATPLDDALLALGDDVRGYLELPQFPGERPHWLAVDEARARFDELVGRARRLVDSGHDREARALLGEGIEPAAERLADAALDAIAFNAANGRRLAAEIEATRDRAARLEDLLTAACIALGVVGAAVLHRQARARRALVDAYTSALEERASELEQFAGRVAHDLRNPLAAAKLAASLVRGGRGPDSVGDGARRIVRALDRAEALTSGLLDFARAGARPDPGARAEPASILEDVVAGMTPAAERSGIELRIERVPPVLVACSDGVYLSLVSNLIRNAIKYMGDAPTRAIVVRVHDGAAVRTEIVDTGPGVDPAIQESLFEPYFRANGSAGEGLGLGLATVKKLSEAHGGRAGVVSAPGAGSAFWFELPRAGSVSGMDPPEPLASEASRDLTH